MSNDAEAALIDRDAAHLVHPASLARRSVLSIATTAAAVDMSDAQLGALLAGCPQLARISLEDCDCLTDAAAPLLARVFRLVLKLAADKKDKAVRLAAKPAAKAVLAALPKAAVIVFVMDHLVAGDDAGLSKLAKWQTKVLALRLLTQASKMVPADIATEMPRLVPLVSEQ